MSQNQQQPFASPRFDPCVFLLGCDRSGTTLLQNLLTSHSSLCISYEAQFAISTKHLYANNDFAALIDAVDTFPQFKKVDKNALRRSAANGEVSGHADFTALVFRLMAAAEGKKIWGDKTPGYTTKVSTLAKDFPNARFIHIVRDPRAVAFSWAPAIWGPNTVFHAAKEWRRHVNAAVAALNELGSDRSVLIRYEDLLNAPEIALTQICELLDIEFEPRMLDTKEREKAKLPSARAQRLHSNRTGELNQSRINSWRKGNRRAINTIESICWEEMQGIHYEPIFMPRPSINKFTKLSYQVANRALETRKKMLRRSQGIAPPKFPLNH